MHFERCIKHDTELALEDSRVVVVTGPRQVGKTTVVRRVIGPTGTVRRLDDETTRAAALADPHSFVESQEAPLAIDEVQLGNEALIRAIKARVDRTEAPGQFLLNGSANFLTVPHITESLAGRASFLTMWPLSQGEISGTDDGLVDLAFSDQADLLELPSSGDDMNTYLSRICDGGFPEPLKASTRRSRSRWFGSYVRSMATRDIQEIADVRNADLLPKLLRVLAARTASEFVATNVAEDVGSDRRTVERYLSLLEMMYLVHRLPAWSRNLTSREARRSKVYISDTGLAASLMRKNEDSLATPTDPARGPLTETFVVNELLKQAARSELEPSLFHYRDRNGDIEVDVVIEAGGAAVGYEVKASSSVAARDARHLAKMRDQMDNIQPGAFRNGIVLYAGPQVVSLGDRLTAAPISSLWTAPSQD